MKQFDNKLKIFILIIIIILIGIYYFFIKKDDYTEISNANTLIINEQNNETEKTEEMNETEEKIIIHIIGAVKNEGIYELEIGSRIADSIEIAGGLTEDADIQNINLAYILEDGMKIYIPTKSDSPNEIIDNTEQYIYKENTNLTISENQQNSNKSTKNQKVNINTATQAELETLPGIGPSTALKIIEYRKENGKFRCIEDITKIKGIGESKYNKIKDLIKV